MTLEIFNDGDNQPKPQSSAEKLYSSMQSVTPPPVQNVRMDHLVKFHPLTRDELIELRKPLVSRLIAWMICIALAVAADWFFWEQPCGMTLGLFVLLLGDAAFLSLPKKRPAMLAALLVFISAAALVVQLSTWGILLAAFSLISMVVISRTGPLRSVREWFCVVGDFLKQALPQSIADMWSSRIAFAKNNSTPNRPRSIKNALWLLWFTFIFLLLFFVANPVLEKNFSRLTDNIQKWMGDNIILHMLFWLAIMLAGWMCMRFCIRAFTENNRLDVKLPTFSGSFTTQCLVAFNIVFLLQTVTDICYLWSGAELPEGLTYAQYAQRGAYPLAIAAILAGVFMVFAWSDDREKYTPTAVRSILATIWLVQNIFLMVCAAWRLYLYVSAYSMTHLRFIAGLGMLLVAIGFITIAVRIYRAKTANWLLTVNSATITMAVIFCAFFNTSGWIAEFNVSHCSEVSSQGVYLDLDYMKELGPEALPAMLRYAKISRDKPTARTAMEIFNQKLTIFETDMQNWRYRTVQRAAILWSLKRDIKNGAYEQVHSNLK